MTVAAIARWNGIAMRTGFRMPQEGANPLIQFRTDDVFKLASLRTHFVVLNPERVLEQSLCKSMPPDHIPGALMSLRRQLHVLVSPFHQAHLGHSRQ